MPYERDLSRRRLLAATPGALGLGGLALLGGCSAEPSSLVSPSIKITEPLDEALRETALASELELIAAYEAVIAAHPQLAPNLSRILDQHRIHTEACTKGEAVPQNSIPWVSPPTASAAVAELIELEKSAAKQRAGVCEVGVEPEFVTTMALISGSEAQHARELVDLRSARA